MARRTFQVGGPLFTATADERRWIERIALRAMQLEREAERQKTNEEKLVSAVFGARAMLWSKADWMMDIEACHSNGTPLNLEKLAKADDFNFAHDVFQIRRFLDRETGKLKGFFLPRCARPEQKGR